MLADKDDRRLGRPRQGAPDRARRPALPGRRRAQPAALAAGPARCSCRPGSSEDGRDFAAQYAEAIFTAQQTLGDAQEFYADIKARAATFGRDPDKLLVLPGIVPAIGSTEAEARALEEELDRLILPEYARRQLARTLRVAPERLRLDEQLPDDLPAEDQIEGAKSRYTLIVTLARRERLTVRELIGRLGGGRGHRTFSGTPGAGRRRHRALVHQRRGRRLQRHAARPAVRARGVRRPRRPDPAAARPVPHGVRRHDAARALRPRPSRQPVRPHHFEEKTA